MGSSIISRFKHCKIPDYKVINKGIPGLVTNEMFSKPYLKSILKNNKYDYMIFYCGNNDLKEGIDTKEVVENIKRFISLCKENLPSTKILVLSILNSPENHKLDIIDDIRYMNNCLKKIDGIQYININRELSKPKYYLEDGVHLDTIAYEKLNQIIKEKM